MENKDLDKMERDVSEEVIPKGFKKVEGKRENALLKKDKKGKCNTAEHNLKINLNQVVRDAGKAGIPIFTVFYSEEDGYVFNGILPEEIGTPRLRSEYGKFDEFLRTCIGFNNEDDLKSVKIMN